MAFVLQLSVEVLANHKFINAWLIVANLFVAYGLIRLWQARSALAVPARFVALGLVVIIVAGGVIDLMPVKNQFVIRVGMQGDRLFDWVRDETDRNAVFLTDLHVVHRILLAGRRIYFGWPYYAWSAGYDVTKRESWYRELFADRSPRDVVERLQAAGIDYVAFDDGLRERGFAQRMNQEVFDTYLEPVFTDPDNRYNNTTIYRVPTEPAATLDLPDAPAEDMYTGGTGSAPGQFAEPRGIALDKFKHVYVADTGNGRIQEFSSDGSLVRTIGEAGTGEGQLDRPTGVAVTTDRHIHVATADGRVHEYDAEGTHLGETRGPAPGFGPLADIVAVDNRVFVLDPDNGRVVRIDENGTETLVRERRRRTGSAPRADGHRGVQLLDPRGRHRQCAGRRLRRGWRADERRTRSPSGRERPNARPTWPVTAPAGPGCRTRPVTRSSSTATAPASGPFPSRSRRSTIRRGSSRPRGMRCSS